MVKAKVSLDSVTNLQQKADAEIEPVESLRHSTNCISEITQRIDEEVLKILETIPECQNAIEKGQDKLQELEDELEGLEAELASTPPTITVIESDGVDSEGNTKYTTRTVPNPVYVALEQEIAELECKINHLDGLISELDQQVQTLEETRERFERAQTTFLSNQKTINSTCTSLIRKSEHASEQLKRAEKAIQNYLDEQVQLNAVPSHTSIVWESTSQNSSLICSTKRLIPGKPGVVRKSSGEKDSTVLKRNLIKEFEIPETYKKQIPKRKTPGYEAHHIIPIERATHPVIEKIGMDMNDASNGILLPTPTNHFHALATHRGDHNLYNNLVKEELDRLDISKPVEDLEVEVYNIQQTLRMILEQGDPIYKVHKKTKYDKLNKYREEEIDPSKYLRESYERCKELRKTKQSS